VPPDSAICECAILSDARRVASRRGAPRSGAERAGAPPRWHAVDRSVGNVTAAAPLCARGVAGPDRTRGRRGGNSNLHVAVGNVGNVDFVASTRAWRIMTEQHVRKSRASRLGVSPLATTLERQLSAPRIADKRGDVYERMSYSGEGVRTPTASTLLCGAEKRLSSANRA